MRKIVLYIAASLDGYIAKKDGDIGWLHDPSYALKGEDYGYQSFYDSIDTTFMGNATYQTIKGFDAPFPYADKKNYVISRKPHPDEAYATYVSGDLKPFIENMKNTSGKDIWLVGGGQINSLFLKNGWIDRMILTRIPVLLGEGIPLFPEPIPVSHLKLENTVSYESSLSQSSYVFSPD